MTFMKALTGKVGAWLIALAGVVISVLVVIVRQITKENSRLQRNVESAAARINHARVVSQKNIYIIQNEQVREVEIIKDLERHRSDYDPNKLFNDKNGSD